MDTSSGHVSKHVATITDFHREGILVQFGNDEPCTNLDLDLDLDEISDLQIKEHRGGSKPLTA